MKVKQAKALLVLSILLFFIPFASAKEEPANRITINTRSVVAPIDPHIYGGFLEHLGRVVYKSIYAPQHPKADKDGLRQDTVAALKELGATIYRYPGGNFVSGYSWLDGVGPKEKRPTKFDMAWRVIETNQFGTDEFMDFLDRVQGEAMLTVNLGTGTEEMAAALVEYCNSKGETFYADVRIKNGYPEPHGVKYWCLGNEMTLAHQLGHMSPADYAKKAERAAHMMKQVDPSIKLVASLNYKEITRKDVLETQLVEKIDYVSAHFYRVNNRSNDKRYLAVGMGLDDYLGRARKAVDDLSKSKKVHLYMCFDEWGARLQPEWRKRTPDGNKHYGEFAPAIGEWPIYMIDSIVDAQFFNAFIRNADLVKLANYSTLVNWFAPIRTNDKAVLKQIFFYIFQIYRLYGHGLSLRPEVTSQTYFDGDVEIPYLDVSACYQKESQTIRLFIVNRDIKDKRFVQIVVEDKVISGKTKAVVIGGAEPYAANSFENPTEVLPKALSTQSVKPAMLELAPLSLTFLELKLR